MSDKFYYVEGNTSVKSLIKTLATEITKNAGLYNWDLVYPESLESIGLNDKIKKINLITDDSTTNKISTEFNISECKDVCILKAITSYNKEFFVKISRENADLTKEEKIAIKAFNSTARRYSIRDTYYNRNDAETLEYMAGLPTNGSSTGTGNDKLYNDYVSAMTKTNAINHINIQFSNKLNKEGNDLDIPENIQKKYKYRLAWYRKLQPEIKDWLPVEYWINVTKDNINIILQGDPSADVEPYKSYLTSYCYIGSLKPVEDSATTDDVYNFGVTTSSDIEPEFSKPYGERTGTGITDFCMLANKIGMPYQPHYPAFYTTNPFMDKCNVEGSRYNHNKHQFSDITLVHPIDMERGKMINVLVGDGSNINNTDKLVYKKGTEEEEHYKRFKITAPYNFLNNSANINYCLAIRCNKVE